MLAASTLIALSAPPMALFVDVTSARKLDFKHESSATSNKYLIETMGGGVALIDYNNDGRLDVFFTNGARLEDPMPPGRHPSKTGIQYHNRLFRAGADGTYTDVTGEAGLTGSAAGGYGMGAAVGDYDNDGYDDLYVTNYGANVLYHNRGDGTFEDVTRRAGVAASGWSTSAGFFDYDNDGLLDLFTGRYLDWDFGKSRYCGDSKPGRRSYCHPDSFSGITNVLFHNNGDGTFTDVSKKAGIANPDGKTLGVAFADYNGDGWPDIYVANDSVRSFLYHNNRDGTFTDVALEASTGFNEDGRAFAGMGVDFADYNNDGLPDIIVTDLSTETYPLYRNNGDGTFTYATVTSGVGKATWDYSGWGTRFIDYDNDGWKDIFAAQGHVMDTIHLTNPNLRYLQPPLLLRNDGTHFRDAASATGGVFARAFAGRGAAFGDLDNDGDMDVVVSNCGQGAYILSNAAGSRNQWLRIELTGTRSNRNAIGSRVTVHLDRGLSQSYEVQTASSYLSAHDRRVLIGMGREKVASRVEIRWPSGTVQIQENVRAGQTLALKEPEK
jgi:hypothetical protein